MKFVAGTTLSANGGGTTSPAIDTTGADLIVAAMVCDVGAFPAVEIHFSDSKGNGWADSGTASQNDGLAASTVGIMYSVNPTVGTGHTFTMGAGAGNRSQALAIAAYKRANLGYDHASAGGSSSASFTVQPGSVTPGANNSLVIMVATVVQTAASLSINQGFTIRENQPFLTGSSYGVLIADLFQGTAGAVNPTLTSDLNTNGMGAISYVFAGLPELVPFCQILG